MRRLLVLLAALLLTACGKPEPVAFGNTDITGAGFGRALTGMSDQHGQPRTLADFAGKAVIVFFGYTSCPDVCPTTLTRLSRVMSELGADAERVQVLLITVDPERDTPEKLTAYMSAFNPSFLALRGDMAATQASAKEFKVFFAKTKPAQSGAHQHHEGMDMSDDADYIIDHSAGVYAFDPQGRIRLYIKDDAVDALVVKDLRRLLTGA